MSKQCHNKSYYISRKILTRKIDKIPKTVSNTEMKKQVSEALPFLNLYKILFLEVIFSCYIPILLFTMYKKTVWNSVFFFTVHSYGYSQCKTRWSLASHHRDWWQPSEAQWLSFIHNIQTKESSIKEAISFQPAQSSVFISLFSALHSYITV